MAIARNQTIAENFLIWRWIPKSPQMACRFCRIINPIFSLTFPAHSRMTQLNVKEIVLQRYHSTGFSCVYHVVMNTSRLSCFLATSGVPAKGSSWNLKRRRIKRKIQRMSTRMWSRMGPGFPKWIYRDQSYTKKESCDAACKTCH